MEDDISKAIKDVIDKYHKAKPAVVNGKDSIEIIPRFTSAMYKAESIEGRRFVNGLPAEEQPDFSTRQCLRVRMYSGDHELGSGLCQYALTDVGKDPRIIRMALDDAMGEIVKTSVSNYLIGLGETIFTKNPSHLESIGLRTVEIHKGTKLNSSELDQINDFVAEASAKASRPEDIVQSHLTQMHQDSIYVDSLGSDVRQSRKEFSFVIGIDGYDDHDQRISFSDNLFVDSITKLTKEGIEEKAQEVRRLFDLSKRAIRINSGPYPVLFDGAATGVFFHEAIGAHLVSGKYVVEGDSNVFGLERLGEIVIPPFLSLIDDPTLPDFFGSYDFDEQGVKATREVLVEKGRLLTYLLDVGSAAKISYKTGLKMKSNGRARSEWVVSSLKGLPLEPRVSNLFVEVDEENLLSEKEIWEYFYQTIAAHPLADFGLYVQGGGGAVDIETGLFQLFPDVVWKVDQNGKKEMIKDTTLVGNIDSYLGTIIAAGYPYNSKAGHCGSSSGMVPTQEHAPAMLFANLTAVAEGENFSTGRLKIDE